MALQDTSLVWKVLMVLQAIGLILTVTGFASPNQIQGERYEKFHVGLWKACFSECHSVEYFLNALDWSTTWLDASKVMMGVSIGGELLVIVLSLLAFVMTLTKLLGLVTGALALLSSILGLIGVAVFQVESKKLFNKLTYNVTVESAWSLYVFLVGQLLYILCCAGHLYDSRQRSR